MSGTMSTPGNVQELAILARFSCALGHEGALCFAAEAVASPGVDLATPGGIREGRTYCEWYNLIPMLNPMADWLAERLGGYTERRPNGQPVG